jgi:hypothetical protein
MAKRLKEPAPFRDPRKIIAPMTPHQDAKHTLMGPLPKKIKNNK